MRSKEVVVIMRVAFTSINLPVPRRSQRQLQRACLPKPANIPATVRSFETRDGHKTVEDPEGTALSLFALPVVLFIKGT